MLRKVLVVEDEAISRRMLRNILSQDYDVLEAENGKEALDILHKKNKYISAVLLDLMMPIMDGFEVLQQMRSNAVLAQIPVIVATASAEEEIEVKALSLGANDFVTKPYNPALITHCLRNTINLRENASIVNAIQRDKLTGLYNRETFFEKVTVMLKEQKPGYYIMACFDIKNFKIINDQQGAEAGDQILRSIGKAVQQEMMSVHGIGCRISADNFAVLYPAACKGTDFIAKMQKNGVIPAAIQTATAFSEGRYVVTDLTLSASAIYDRAYIAKQSVKGRYDCHIAYFDHSMLEKLIREQEISAEMDVALAQQNFEVWFQPQYNHATGALVGAEALVRWRHPHKGLIQPADFIPVFEQNGFIYELDKFVWEKVCALLRQWLDEGRTPLPVSVNISRYDVFRADLLDVLTGLLEKYNIPVALLRLEITESAFASSSEQIILVVRQLIAYGFTVEIDDFGSGYSSLNTLKDVPAQVLKLDMRFLENNDDSQRSGNIIESVVRMTKWLGMAVIAEGVEKVEQADYLKSIGSNYVQGYLYAKPMTVAEYEKLAQNTGKEEKLITLETVENLNNNSFWDPESMDTLIFNSYVGGACIYEYNNGNIELLRATDKYAQIIGSAGMTVEEALKLDWMEHLDAASRQEVIAVLHKSAAAREEVTGEYVFYDLPGCPHETFLRSTMRVIAAVEDRYLVYCTNENMTAQRQAERKEHEAEQKRLQAAAQLQAIMNNINGGVTAFNFDDNGLLQFHFSNDEYYAMQGYTREQFAAEVKDVFDLVHPDDKKTLEADIEKAISTKSAASFEFRIRRRNGEYFYAHSNVSVCSIEGVGENVILSVITDVTELYETDRQLVFLNDIAHVLLAQPDSALGIEETLSKILAYFGGSRAYVYELNHENALLANTYEVCNEDVSGDKGRFQRISLSVISFWLELLERQSCICIDDVADLDDSLPEKQVLQAQNIKSIIAVPLMRDGKVIGFFGIDNPRRQQARLNRLEAIGDFFAVMLTRRDLNEKIKNDDETIRLMLHDAPGKQ